MMRVGDNPAECYCRICGQRSAPPYPGYELVAVCSRECFDEYEWRKALGTLKRPYHPREPAPGEPR